MVKNVILLLIFLMVAGIGYWGYKDSQEKNDYSDLVADRDFNVENTDQIYTIKLTRRNRRPTTLRKKDGIWYTDQKRANENMVTGILNAIRAARIQSIPATQAVNNIIQEVNQVGCQVDLYDKSDGLMKSFFVGGNTYHETGTYFLMQNSVQPYIMELPYMKGGLRDIFVHNEDEFLDPYYLRINSKDIKSVKIDYPKDKRNSFFLDKGSKGEFTVSPIYNTTKTIERKVNQITVDAYLSEYQELASESIETNGPMADELFRKIPFAKIELTFEDGSKKDLTYYPSLDFLKETMDFTSHELENLRKIPRFFLDTSWGEIYGVQSRLCRELFVGYSYFFR